MYYNKHKEVYISVARMNITMPEDVYGILQNVKNKSAYIADAIRIKSRLEEKERASRALEAAYREAAADDYAEYREWEETLKDGLEE
ncbi:MAG: hypothetical protein FD164_1572 [Nitrospirae bacterium]|nr:MAG: hypothetical protein FD164_1572 [Nitrospirota bacterium]